MKPDACPIFALLLVLTLQPAVAGQEPPAAPKPVPAPALPAPPSPPAAPLPVSPPAPPSAQTPLRAPVRLNVVVSKYQNDKKLSSLPYSISVNTNNVRASMRMGAQIPCPTSTASEGKPVPGYSYRDVGVRIDASAYPHEPGVYRVDVTVEDTSISTGNQVQGATAFAGVPIFKNFVIANNTVLLKDGQTTQLSSAADPISGETMRVDITLIAK